MAKILLVDDERVVLKTAQNMLMGAGHVVHTALDGHQASDMVEKDIFDLVITDVNMPNGISGFNLAAIIRQNERYKKVPIMFLTGRNELKDVQRAISSGADDYLIKPVEESTLLAKVEALLQKSGRTELKQVRISGELLSKVEITGVSVFNLKLVSPVEFRIGQKIRIETSLFSDLEIETPQMKVISCNALGDKFACIVNLVGMKPEDVETFKEWIKDLPVKKAS